MTVILHPGWKDWYHLKHKDRSTAQGSPFENYLESILVRHHDDYVNPAPAGSLGDGGCDGIAENGSILYACYGSQAKKDTERKLREKIASDFKRGTASWSGFDTWRFVTNASTGPECVKQIVELQATHAEGTERPLTIRLWNPEKVWIEILSGFSSDKLDELFPGAPGTANVALEDLIPLLDDLRNGDALRADEISEIRPVPTGKVEYNKLPQTSQLELNSGRTLATRIDTWFAESSDPSLHDEQAARFCAIYEENKAVVSDPGELLERIYVAVGGSDFRLDNTRANAVYAVVAYYFDECHIFEEPPPDFRIGSVSIAATN